MYIDFPGNLSFTTYYLLIPTCRKQDNKNREIRIMPADTDKIDFFRYRTEVDDVPTTVLAIVFWKSLAFV